MSEASSAAASAAASATGSAAKSATATVNDATEPVFTDKELKLLVAALLSLKAGPPDVDIKRFQTNAGFNTGKTASNAWGKLKKKLKELNPEAEAGGKSA